MSLPENLRYTESHEWVLQADGLLWVGITDHAQEALGDLVFVGDVEVGSELEQGDKAGVVESVKAASDIYAPVAGEIVEFNAELEDAPEKLNEQPFETWIYKLKPSSDFPEDFGLDASAYQALIDEA